MENLIGKVGICSIGYIGVIKEYTEASWGWTWSGAKLDSGSSWASRTPYIIADSIEEFAEMKDFINWDAIETDWKAFMESHYGECKYRLERLP
jgi:hypothetical protein